jgi:preprotein translocase subunit YajC
MNDPEALPLILIMLVWIAFPLWMIARQTRRSADALTQLADIAERNSRG